MAVTGAEWALVIRRGIAEEAERAFLCGWWRRPVQVAAGDGCRNGGELVQKMGLWACAQGPLAWDCRRRLPEEQNGGGGPGVAVDRLRVVQVWRLVFGGAGRLLGVGCLGPGVWYPILWRGDGRGMKKTRLAAGVGLSSG